MTDLDPEIWNNPTLGKAAYNERLDRLEKQQLEDRSAKREGREPREVVVDNDYPDWQPSVSERTGTVPSNATVVRFADEQPNDILQTGNGMKPDGISDEEWNAESPTEGSSADETEDTGENSEGTVEVPATDDTEESDTQWT